MATVKCSAAGDVMIFRRLPSIPYDGFLQLKDYITQADFRFVNLETTIHRFETYGAALSGGSWFCSAPEVLEDVKAFGFNMVTSANNHAMDYSHKGLEKTLEYIQAAGLQTCGTGKNLAQASAPVYLDTPGGRIALIGVCSTFYEDAMAGEQSRTCEGRPGLNGLHFDTTYGVSPEQMKQLQELAQMLSLNDEGDIARREGYKPALPEGKFMFGNLMMETSSPLGKHTHVRKADMTRVENAIQEALFMADYVIVSVHSHEMGGKEKEIPAEFLVEFCRGVIDAGAHAVIGSGPHLLRPMEIYKGCPIFYSLGDFIIQLENIRQAPADMFRKQGLSGNEGLHELFHARSGGKRGLYYEKVMFESVVPYWEWKDGRLTKLTLLPVELNFHAHRSMGGWPRPCGDEGILERLEEMSRPYGISMKIENGMGTVMLKEC